MRTKLKDVVLICKGWYDTELYSIEDALKLYYKQNYCSGIEFDNWRSALLKIVLYQAMQELAENYPDRLKGFVNLYVFSDRNVYGMPNNLTSYEDVMFYKIVNFFHTLKMRGDGFVEIDTDEYFEDDFNDKRSSTCREKLVFHENKKVLKEPIFKEA